MEAARALGCLVSQIAKSIVFRAAQSGRPVLVVASGSHRVNEAVIANLLGEPIQKASPDFVRENTGFAIGGVPPVAHQRPPVTFVDARLLSLTTIWAAAGTPNHGLRAHTRGAGPAHGWPGRRTSPENPVPDMPGRIVDFVEAGAGFRSGRRLDEFAT